MSVPAQETTDRNDVLRLRAKTCRHPLCNLTVSVPFAFTGGDGKRREENTLCFWHEKQDRLGLDSYYMPRLLKKGKTNTSAWAA